MRTSFCSPPFDQSGRVSITTIAAKKVLRYNTKHISLFRATPLRAKAMLVALLENTPRGFASDATRSGALAILGRAIGAVCGSDRDLRQNRRGDCEFRLGDANPYAGRDMRARAYRICDRAASGPVQDIGPHVSVPPPFGPRYRRIVALLFSRPQARQRGAGGADRQAQRRHCCDTWCRVT